MNSGAWSAPFGSHGSALLDHLRCRWTDRWAGNSRLKIAGPHGLSRVPSRPPLDCTLDACTAGGTVRRSAVLRPALRFVAQQMIRERDRDHRLAHRHEARQEARVVAALDRDGRRIALLRDRALLARQ